ncbi:MAG TPA: LCP family protein [Actinophytocola sp.]|uniref:LCP family protein n=1 Tax=Actinophytocola sp. TaxID=1872138 RepID=UPI002DB8FEAE|nr:LCP family protein [Actinophytocola sp.]HEU5475836.1 LCP family protein [Actinophytocola sp.]
MSEDGPTDIVSVAGSFDPDELPPPPPPPRRRRGPRVLLISVRVLIGLFSAAVLAATALVDVKVDQLQDSVNTTDALAEAQEQADAPAVDDGANDILIVGSDTRTDLQGNPLPLKLLKELRTEATETLNTDTLILVRFPRNGAKGYAVSIPRDTYVPVPNWREEKINGAFGVTKARAAEDMVRAGEKDRKKIERDSDSAGRSALIGAVQGLTGVRIDHYAEITLYGFYLLTKAIDGVEVCLKQATSDTDSGANFRRGTQTVRGADAVSFVRQRNNLPRGDLDRIVRQQVFLSSAINKVLSGGMLTDTGKLNELSDAVSKTVVMDPGLHFLDLVNQAQALASGAVEFVTIPVTGVGARNDRGQSIITVDIPAVHSYIAQLISGARPPMPSPVVPPTGPPGLRGPQPLALNGSAVARAAAVPCID